MKKFILPCIFILLLTSNKIINAQISVSSYSIYALGVQTPIGKKLTFETKIFANRGDDILESQLEPTLFYNFREYPYHKFSAGLGFNFNIYADLGYVTIPVQLEVFPFQDFKKLSFVIELGLGFPYLDPFLRHLWGIRYRFGAN